MVGKGWLFDRLVGSLFVFFLIVVKGLDSPCTGSVDLRDNLASVLRQVPRLRYSENDISVGCKSSAGASPLPETAVVIISCGVSEHRLRFFRHTQECSQARWVWPQCYVFLCHYACVREIVVLPSPDMKPPICHVMHQYDCERSYVFRQLLVSFLCVFLHLKYILDNIQSN